MIDCAVGMPVIVSYDYDLGWLVEIPLASQSEDARYEFSWLHLDEIPDRWPAAGFERKTDAVIVGRSVAKALGLKLTVHSAKEMKAAERAAETARKTQIAAQAYHQPRQRNVCISSYTLDSLRSKLGKTRRTSDSAVIKSAIEAFLLSPTPRELTGTRPEIG
jgi:hypothetical protein